MADSLPEPSGDGRLSPSQEIPAPSAPPRDRSAVANAETDPPPTAPPMENEETGAASAEEPLLEQPQARPYPDPFYCPLTGNVMEDPVVAPDGGSFEKSAALERDPFQTYYDNRALRAIIEKEKHRVRGLSTVRGALERADESLRAGFAQVLDRAALPTREYRPLPDAYYCPITLDLIQRPAIDPEGNTYERRAIMGWIQANGKSPLTREELVVESLRDNHALDDLLEAEAGRAEGSIHPSFRRWKEGRDDETPGDDAPNDETPGDESGPYPTTPEEIRDRDRDKKCICTWVGLILLILLFVFLPIEIAIFTIVCVPGLCIGYAACSDDGDGGR